uniref:RING-type domain-containing protein n=1 Tax=Plectus sambesii TaxID=2011161 RepID=A0A914V601_9BILA
MPTAWTFTTCYICWLIPLCRHPLCSDEIAYLCPPLLTNWPYFEWTDKLVCRFNFGADPFVFPPEGIAFCCFNDFAELSDEQRVILPRRRKLELLRQFSVPEDSCHLCYSNTATITLSPCSHSGFCSVCAAQIDQCPLCRTKIAERLVNSEDAPVAAAVSSSVD